MWKPTHLETDVGTLRIGITGTWSLQAFSNLLLGVNDIYARVNVVDFFARAIPLEDQENEKDLNRRRWQDEDRRLRHMFYGFESHGRHEVDFVEPDDFDSLIAVATRHAGSLHLASTSYASPGWVDVFGSLNPLKVIADAFVEWRKQNIEKERIRIQAETERIRIRTEFAVEVLRWCESITARVTNGRDRLSDIEKKVLRPTEEFIARIASDSRITDIRVMASSTPAKETKQGKT